MRVLLVTPSVTGRVKPARDLLQRGYNVHFSASQTTAALLSDTFPGRITVFKHSADENRDLLRGLIRRVDPDSIVFVDSRIAWSQFNVEAIPTKNHIADLHGVCRARQHASPARNRARRRLWQRCKSRLHWLSAASRWSESKSTPPCSESAGQREPATGATVARRWATPTCRAHGRRARSLNSFA